MPPLARAILVRRRKAVPADEPRVFPGLTLTSPAHRALAALRTGYEWKDLRRTVATRLAGLGFDETTIGRTLNHARTTVTSRHYVQHPYLDEVRRALTAWDREIGRIRRHEPAATATVVALRRRR